MAVTIDEMHVEVQPNAPAASAPEQGADAKKDIQLHEAIEMLRERKLRLRAD
ncbi:MAG: hypothetical protein ABSG00_00065 [Terracidiphilus sp.]|jgi:hypothetical protein